MNLEDEVCGGCVVPCPVVDLRNISAEVGLAMLPEESVGLIVTDPPYGIGYKSNKQTSNTRAAGLTGKRSKAYFSQIANDDEIPLEWLGLAYAALKDGGACYVFCHWKKLGVLIAEAERVGFKAKNTIVLVKSNHGTGDLKGSYAPKHEFLLFLAKGRHVFNSDCGRIPDVLAVPVLYSGALRKHPNQKRPEWIQPFVDRSLLFPWLPVCDPFLGSGSLLTAVPATTPLVGFETDKTYHKTAVDLLRKHRKNYYARR